MNFELLLIILVVIVGAILIFKLIKKIVVAMMSFVFLLVIVFAGVGLVVYYDVSSLAQQEEFYLSVGLQNESVGFSIPFEEQDPQFELLRSFGYYEEEDVHFEIGIEREDYELLLENSTVSFNNIPIASLNEYNVSISGEEYIELINEDVTTNEFVDLIISSTSLPSTVEEQARTTLENDLTMFLDEQDLTMQEFIFAVGFVSILDEEREYVTLIQLYRNDIITIEPEKFSLKMINYVPSFLFTFLD